MNVEIEYDGRPVKIDIPEANLMGVITPELAEDPLTPETLPGGIREVTPNTNLKEFVEGSSNDSLLIIINDANRATPSHAVLQALTPLLEVQKNIRVSIATGSHSPPCEDEIRGLLGAGYDRFREGMHIHDARDRDRHRFLGTTSRGTDVLFDDILWSAGNVLVIGSVEPHYFAGYTGGRKAFLPGHAAHGTIEHNHSFSLRPTSSLLNLRGNDVHEDMTEACRLLDGMNIYSIQLVLDCRNNIAGAFGGDLFDAFTAAIPMCRRYFTREIPAPADIVITNAEYPMDISLYQSQKAMENAKPALRPGGTMILMSATRKGIGNPVFADLLSSSDDLDEIIDRIGKEYVLGYQKTAKFIESIRNYRVFVISTLPPDTVRRMHMEPAVSLRDALERSGTGADASILVMPKGSALVPMVRS